MPIRSNHLLAADIAQVVERAHLLQVSGRGKPLFGEVINLTNRTNYIYDSFNGYNSKIFQALRTLDTMFPILPSAGIVCDRRAPRSDRM